MYIQVLIFAISFIIIVNIIAILSVAAFTRTSKTTKMVANKVKEKSTTENTFKEDSINRCEYCGSTNKQGLTQCEHCGANLNNNRK